MTYEEKFPKSDWQYEVANDDTSLGYAEWVQHCIEVERVEAEATLATPLARLQRMRREFLFQTPINWEGYYAMAMLTAAHRKDQNEVSRCLDELDLLCQKQKSKKSE